MNHYYVGLMSGTSTDGVDAVLATIDNRGSLQALHHAHTPFDPALRRELLALNASGADELHRAFLTGNQLARTYAALSAQLLSAAQVPTGQVRAIGAHGQTVRHRPGEFDGVGYTVQLMPGALLAELTGIDVVCDFRSRDLAAGGQGAPLVPAFHAAMFARPGASSAVLNLGGIANLSLLHADGRVGGFDCGPGNVLLDAWCEQHTGRPYDAAGAWSSGGRVLPALLEALLAEPFVGKPPPKSTGRDLFHLDWLAPRLHAAAPGAEPRDVQSTLAEFTAAAAAQALHSQAPNACELLVCGGGAYNGDLMCRLAARLPGCGVCSTADRGLPPMQVEAAAFAWLAHAFMERQPGNLPAATGARGLRVLGAFYPR